MLAIRHCVVLFYLEKTGKERKVNLTLSLYTLEDLELVPLLLSCVS